MYTQYNSYLMSGLNFLFAGWLVISPFILNYNHTATANQLFFGLVILVVSAMSHLNSSAESIEWMCGICALWLIVAPVLLNYPHTIAYWNEVITGIIVAGISFWNVNIYGRYHTPT
jgi:hypothetical protein